MAMSLHLDEDDARSWLDRMGRAPDVPFSERELESYRLAIAREREEVHMHKDSNTRLNAALEHLHIVDDVPAGIPVLTPSTTPSHTPASSTPSLEPPAPPQEHVRHSSLSRLRLPVVRKLSMGTTRSESQPPAGRRPTAALPAAPRTPRGASASASARKGSAPEPEIRSQQATRRTPTPNPTEQHFGTLLKSPAKRPKQPKRRSHFNPEGDEVDEQRWRYHRNELFQSMERGQWADASGHSDAMAEISRDHGCVLSVNERYFFEKINGILLVAQRQSAAALKLAEKSSPENSNTLQLVKCIALVQLGDFLGAKEACQPLFRIWSQDAVLKDQRTHYYLMVMILDRLGKKAEARWYRQHIPENFRFDLWIESALAGLQTEPAEARNNIGTLFTEFEAPRTQSPTPSGGSVNAASGPGSGGNYTYYAPETPASARSDPPPFTPSDPPPPEYQVVMPPARYSERDALDSLTGFNLRYESGQIIGEEVAKKRAILFFLTEYHGDKMYDCIRALLAEPCCRGVIQVPENILLTNSLGLVARNKGPAAGEMARFLLSSGDRPEYLDASADGLSALHVAAKEENFSVLESILNYMGIPTAEDILSRNNNLTPLHLAAEYNRKTLIVSLLLDAGSDVNARGGPVGNTPLHCAIRGYLHDPMPSRLETIDYLLESPYIKIGQRNNNKESPEEYAKLCTLTDLASRIKDMRKNGKAIFGRATDRRR
ncbi:hypothetical protein Dda_6721 [Drechslerella dactyloides]|uniref:Ankyrin repeat protein n=1 Tax=Drechslerella dactyloides TaxID=74499 RepID=A0AAD6IU84_DREDA|nr:hypothetical protein Dda_6721 [Drechslerella dactyloides]